MFHALKQQIRKRFPALLTRYHDYRESRRIRRLPSGTTPFGFRFVGEEAMLAGEFEGLETKAIREWLERVSVFVDVGANVGYFVCHARAMGVHVIAVEPVPTNVGILSRNLALNGWDDVEVLPMALSSEPGKVVLYGGGTGASMLSNWSGTSEAWRHTVPASTLDIVIGDRFCGEQLLIKVDVEGFELGVLQGATKTIQRTPRPIWQMEICLTEHHPQGMNPHFGEIFELFWSNGYAAFTADSVGRRITANDVKRWVDTGVRDFGFINYVFVDQSVTPPRGR